VRNLSAGLYVVARVIAAIAGIIALIIAVGIVFRILGANPDNAIVSFINDLARGLVGPFDGMFKPKDPKTEILVNWGIALAVYLIVGMLIARVVRGVAGQVAAGASRRERDGDADAHVKRDE
jgi:hypothetical protein